MARNPLQQLIGNQRALGVAAIDAGYDVVAECWSRAMACDPLELPLRIARLKKHLTTLHEEERMLLGRAGSKLCFCHESAHAALLAVCREAGALAPENWRRARSLLRYRFSPLFREHLICMDSVMVLSARAAGEDGHACRTCCGG